MQGARPNIRADDGEHATLRPGFLFVAAHTIVPGQAHLWHKGALSAWALAPTNATVNVVTTNVFHNFRMVSAIAKAHSPKMNACASMFVKSVSNE